MPNAQDFSALDCYNKVATVAVNTTTSDEIDLAGTTLCGIFIPSTFDGTTITFTATDAAGGTHMAVYDGSTAGGTLLTITTSASRYEPIANLALFAGIRFLKIVCGSTQTTTSTIFKLATRPV